MFGAVVAFILLFPWALVALTTIGYVRTRRVAALPHRQERRKPADLL
jgi:hypothetical protein